METLTYDITGLMREMAAKSRALAAQSRIDLASYRLGNEQHEEKEMDPTTPDVAAQAPAAPAAAPDRMLQFFEYAHLPEKYQAVSKPFGELAQAVCATLPSNPERTVALRKLLEAKDCAVRALIYKG